MSSSFEEIYRASRTPPNPADLVEGNVYDFTTIRGRGQSIYDPPPSYTNARLISKSTIGNRPSALFRTTEGDMNVDINSMRNLRLLRPRAPILPSPDDRNIPSLATLAKRQLSTAEIHDLNTNYEFANSNGKLYGQNAGLKSKKRRNKKTKTKRRPSKKTKRSHRK
jgi:hypothetical protein